MKRENAEHVKRCVRNGDKNNAEVKDRPLANVLVVTCITALSLFVCLWMAGDVSLSQRVISQETAAAQCDASLVRYRDLIGKYAAMYDLDPAFVTVTVFVESSFQQSAESSSGAIGLMQIMPLTGMWIAGKIGINDYRVEMLLEPDVNIQMGCWYLSYLMKKFCGNEETVSAAYYAGPSKVDEWLADKKYSKDGKTLDVIPYEKTRIYVQRIASYYEIFRGIWGNASCLNTKGSIESAKTPE
ncbi:MAG: lytic transglycosylase domain-containing protein [Bacillota bacterium]